MLTEKQNPNGLHQRYVVAKASGEPIDPKAVYFVLRLDTDGDDEAHTEACREAARAYCTSVFRLRKPNNLRQLAKELWKLVNEIESREPA